MRIAELFDVSFWAERSISRAPMNEMANLYPQKTGLPYVIWFGEIGGQHGPRIKVSNVKGKFALNDNFVVSVAQNPRVLTPRHRRISNDELDDVLDWIQINYSILIEMWKLHETGDGDFASLLDKLKSI